MKISDKLIKIHIDDLTTPKNGLEVITNHWWVMKDDRVLGYRVYGKNSKLRPSPQCNSNKAVVETVMCKMYPEYEAVFIPVAYWEPHRN